LSLLSDILVFTKSGFHKRNVHRYIAPGPDGDTLLVTPRTTRVRNSNFGGALQVESS
jgi:hypothetical protein